MANNFTLNAAKRLKTIGSYEESEILTALNSMAAEDKESIGPIVNKICETLKGVSTLKTGRATAKKTKTATQEEQLKLIVLKIGNALKTYEGSDQHDDWTLKFKIGLDYSSKDINSMKDIHKELLSSDMTADKVKLLTYF